MFRRPRYADVAATLALVVALGGTAAYAVETLPKHSVGKRQIQKDAVTSSKIKNGKVKTQDLKDGGVATVDLADGAVTTPKIAAGSIGSLKLADSSVTGAKIANGTVGLDDLTGGRATAAVNESGVAAGACRAFTVAVAGATAAQTGFLTVTGAVPTGVAFGPVQVTAGAVKSTVCNVSGSALDINVVVRAVTLG